MSWRDRLHYLRNQLNRERAEQELDEEMRLHIQLETEANIAAGMTPEEASRRARMRFGGIDRYREEASEASGFHVIDGLRRDLAYSLRRLMRAPVFTLVTSLTLALGIGSTAAVFAVVYTVLLKPLPYPQPEELVFVSSENESRGWDGFPLPNGAYHAFRSDSRTLQGIAAYTVQKATLLAEAGAERLDVVQVTENFFEVLDVAPILGILPEPAENSPSVLISYGLWQRLFGGSPSTPGRLLQLDGKQYTITGIMPREFWFPDHGHAAWLPGRIPIEDPWRSWSVRGIGRRAGGVPLQSVQQEVDAIVEGFAEHLPFGGGWRFRVTSWQDRTVGEVRSSLLFLLGAVGLVLAVCCLNIANLYLARARDRRPELAVRTALGAGRRVLVRQLMTEHLLLSLLGGGAGILTGFAALRVIHWLAPGDLPRLSEISPGFTLPVFALSAALLSGLAAALLPVIRTARIDPAAGLRQGRQVQAETVRGSRSRNGLVTAQVAAATVLLVCAGLMSGSFIRVLRIEPGVRTENVLTASLALSPDRYSAPQQWLDFFTSLSRELARLPGVEAVGLASGLPTRGVQMMDSSLRVEGQAEPLPLNVGIDVVTPGYFSAMGIPLLSGRFFDESDRMGAPLVTIVNDSIAKRFFPGGDAVGRKFMSTDDETWLTIVGVVGDVKQYGPDKETPLLRYHPWSQEPQAKAYVVIRSNPSQPTEAETVRQVVRRLDASQPVTDVATMESLLSRSVAPRRLSAWLLNIFSGIALCLALIGLYGILSYTVSRRRHEIGIRVALGARRWDVFSRILWHGLKLALIGLAIGLGTALYTTSWLESQLFGLEPNDPFSFLLGTVLVLLVTLAAGYFPARRACKVDPVEALRYE